MSTGTILVVVATEAERPESVRGIEILVSGVGKIAAATTTALRLAEGTVDGVVSFGVAGAYPRTGLALGSVVVATEIATVDEGLDDGARFTPFSRPGMAVPGAEWRPTDPVLRSALALSEHEGREGRVATVSVCAGSARIAAGRSTQGALAEGMEGAAIAEVCARLDVPFVEVRGISNMCGPRDGAPFDLQTAVRNASAVLSRLSNL